LTRALRPRRRRHGRPEHDEARQHERDERALAGSRGAGDDEDRARAQWRAKRPTSSARWRSERPPTVFDWLIRHWLRKRAAFTRPNFGTASSMSKTFAVETYSGGFSRTFTILTRPSLRSFFSFARLTLMSLAR